MSAALETNDLTARLRQEMGLMTEEDLAALVGIKVDTLILWRAENKGPDYVKLGRTVFYQRQDVLDWIKANKVPAQRTGTRG